MNNNKDGIIGALIFSVIVGFICYTTGANAFSVNNFKTNDGTSVQDLVDESNKNYTTATDLLEKYQQLYQNSKDECDEVDKYFGSEASDDCTSTVFNNVDGDGSDVSFNNAAATNISSYLTSSTSNN